MLKKIKEWFYFLLAIAAIFAVISLVISYEMSLWNECRKDHGWMYCNRILNK